MDVDLDLRESATRNAREHYEKSKKAIEKLRGAEKALEDTKKKIQKLGEKSIVIEKKIRKKTVKEKKWYDKFRWFTSSDNFLVVGGRDSATNEILVKKHTEKNDLVFHANIQGAPFFVIKNPENKKIPEDTMKEAAEAAASYSSSWKRGLGSCDVYSIRPNQVSKKAESGEYLPKGGFMIRGEKNWYRNTSLKIAIGFNIRDDVEVVGGPAGAVKKQAKYCVEISVGDLKSKELALEIKKHVQQKTGKEDGLKIKNVNLDEIQKYIPGGEGRLLT